MDGCRYENCEFIDCTLIYSGGNGEAPEWRWATPPAQATGVGFATSRTRFEGDHRGMVPFESPDPHWHRITTDAEKQPHLQSGSDVTSGLRESAWGGTNAHHYVKRLCTPGITLFLALSAVRPAHYSVAGQSPVRTQISGSNWAYTVPFAIKNVAIIDPEGIAHIEAEFENGRLRKGHYSRDLGYVASTGSSLSRTPNYQALAVHQ